MHYQEHTLFDRLSASLRQLESAEVTCFHCRERRAEWFCVNCRTNICVKCAPNHTRVHKDHKFQIIPYADDLSEFSAIASIVYCHIHSGEKTKLYCRTCETPVCHICKYASHDQLKHQTETTEDAKSRICELFRGDLEKLGESVRGHNDQANWADIRLQQLEEKGKAVLRELGQRKDQLILRVENEYQRECKKLYALIGSGTENLSQYKEVNDQQAKAKKSVLLTTRVCLDHMAGRSSADKLIGRLKLRVHELSKGEKHNDGGIEESVRLPELNCNQRIELEEHLLGEIQLEKKERRSRFDRIKQWAAKGSAHFKNTCQSKRIAEYWYLLAAGVLGILVSCMYSWFML